MMNYSFKPTAPEAKPNPNYIPPASVKKERK